MKETLTKTAALLRERNRIDAELATIIKRPMTSGHLGEWIAAETFGIELQASAVARGIDGRFRSGELTGRTVNVKWYLKQEGLLDISDYDGLDFYLVLTGPASGPVSSRGSTRPWCIDAVYLFDARQLRSEQTARGVKLGTASSVTKKQWDAARVYPAPAGRPMLSVSPDQETMLKLFASER